jgi:hypothetical protein
MPSMGNGRIHRICIYPVWTILFEKLLRIPFFGTCFVITPEIFICRKHTASLYRKKNKQDENNYRKYKLGVALIKTMFAVDKKYCADKNGDLDNT